MRVALAGNPKSGKTTMFNALTGRNERVGDSILASWQLAAAAVTGFIAKENVVLGRHCSSVRYRIYSGFSRISDWHPRYNRLPWSRIFTQPIGSNRNDFVLLRVKAKNNRESFFEA